MNLLALWNSDLEPKNPPENTQFAPGTLQNFAFPTYTNVDPGTARRSSRKGRASKYLAAISRLFSAYDLVANRRRSPHREAPGASPSARRPTPWPSQRSS